MRICCLLPAFLWTPLHAQNSVRLLVDATDAPRRLFHVQMSMPAKAGPMTLLYPEWIPGEHGPTGPIANMVGLKIQGGGKTIAWKRDSVSMFAFHLDVPAGGRRWRWPSTSSRRPNRRAFLPAVRRPANWQW